MANIIVVEDKTLSKEFEKRYVVVDKDTGEILDNAQGYGYKTIKNAYAAYKYKTRDRNKDKEISEKKEHIKQWMKEHSDFVKDMDEVALIILKGRYGPDAKFDTKVVEEMLESYKLEPDFSAYELLRVWQNRKRSDK